MKLSELLSGIDYDILSGSTDIMVNDISYDSRLVKSGDVFVALIGIDSDGHDYISDAIHNGSKCIIVCKDVIFKDVTVIKISDTRKYLSMLSSNLFGNPQKDLIKIGITGTKGKTSTSWMIKSILEANGEKVGLVGTVGTYVDGVLYEHKNTTPESYLIQKYMRMMVDSGIKYLVMEVSSAALKSERVNNIIFDYGIFTNLSIDHVGLREHLTYEDYVISKAKLFKQCKIGFFNSDDDYKKMVDGCSCKIYKYGTDGDIVISGVSYVDCDFLGCEFSTTGIVNDTFRVSVPGLFSVYNACAAVMISHFLGVSNDVIKLGLSSFSVPGRCNVINVNDFTVVIDYAHNKVSMEEIINTMRSYCCNRIITVFGCGGGRSYERRYELGYVSGKLSDLSIVTCDNPRNDDIGEINSDIVKGISDTNGNYLVIPDRKEAILYSLNNALSGDIILILGKGHERFQEINGVIYPFDEEKIIRDFMEDL